MNGRRYDPSPARARAIRQAREQANMSQPDLARALGYKSATPVRQWEAAVLDPGPAVVERIAVATRTRVSLLLMPSRCPAPSRPSRTADGKAAA